MPVHASDTLFIPSILDKKINSQTTSHRFRVVKTRQKLLKIFGSARHVMLAGASCSRRQSM
jgi:hypothetical protein